jgi:hypothetical protein
MPAGPEGTLPYGAPPDPGQTYHSAPTQMYGEQQPQQPGYDPAQNPYGGQQTPPFGAPTDPSNQQPYANPQQGFGAPQNPYGAPGQPQFGYPAAPPPKKNNGLIVGLVIAAVVVVGGGVGAYIAFHKSGGGTPVANSSTPAPVFTTAPQTTTAPTPTDDSTGSDSSGISLPQSTDGLMLLNTSVAQQAVSRVQGGLNSTGDSSGVYQNALIGAYGPTSNGDPTTILVVQPLTNLSSTDQEEFQDSSPSDIVSGIMSGATATNVQTVDSSDPDAAISCGNVTSSGVSFYMCSWVDEDTFGVTYFYNNPSPTTAGDQTDQLRFGADGD